MWDLPGAGTEAFPRETYISQMGLRYFDMVLLVTAHRFTQMEKEITEDENFTFWGAQARGGLDAGFIEGPREKRLVLCLLTGMSAAFGASSGYGFILSEEAGRLTNKYQGTWPLLSCPSRTAGQQTTKAVSTSSVTAAFLHSRWSGL